MDDNLSHVLDAIERGTRVGSPPRERGFTLVSFGPIPKLQLVSLRSFQSGVERVYGVKIPAVGGGNGLAQIHFEIRGESPEKARDFIRALVTDAVVWDRLKLLSIRLVIVRQPYVRLDLALGWLDCSATTRLELGLPAEGVSAATAIAPAARQ